MLKKILNMFVNWKYRKLITETKKEMRNEKSYHFRMDKYVEFILKVNMKTDAATEIKAMI